jgi:hypothetical protein
MSSRLGAVSAEVSHPGERFRLGLAQPGEQLVVVLDRDERPALALSSGRVVAAAFRAVNAPGGRLHRLNALSAHSVHI